MTARMVLAAAVLIATAILTLAAVGAARVVDHLTEPVPRNCPWNADCAVPYVEEP